MKLSDQDVELFYKLMWSLQFFVNQRLGLVKVKDADAYARLGQQDKVRVRDALWEHEELIDAFIAANPAGLAPDELAIVQSWRRRVTGDFFIERYLKKGAVFIGGPKPERVYLVLALLEEFDDILPIEGLPQYVKAVLLPFRGQIIYDGLLIAHSIFFGGNIRAELRESYMRAKQQGTIVESLEPGQAVVRLAPRTSRATADLGPALTEIVAMVDKLKAPGDPVLTAALGILKASARLALINAQSPDDVNGLIDLTEKLNKAARRYGTALERRM
jgi:hypothetical protein